MKIKYLYLLLPLILFSCEKDCFDCQECIFGKWELVKGNNIITDECTIPENEHQIEFTEDFIFKRFFNDSLTTSLRFEFTGEAQCGVNKWFKYKLFINDLHWTYLYQFNEDRTLTITLADSLNNIYKIHDVYKRD